jgi:hypothetical protein
VSAFQASETNITAKFRFGNKILFIFLLLHFVVVVVVVVSIGCLIIFYFRETQIPDEITWYDDT